MILNNVSNGAEVVVRLDDRRVVCTVTRVREDHPDVHVDVHSGGTGVIKRHRESFHINTKAFEIEKVVKKTSSGGEQADLNDYSGFKKASEL